MAWTELVVDAEKKLPAICLKCGAKKHIVRRKERLTAATATQGLSAVGAVCGVMVAVGLSAAACGVGFFAHETSAYVIAGALLGGVIITALAFRLRDRFVHASAIQGTRVVLRGVSDSARTLIEARVKRDFMA